MIIALLGASDLNYIVSFFALSRLGYVVFLLSPRLAPLACAALLKKMGCHMILYTPLNEVTVTKILQERFLSSMLMIRRSDFDKLRLYKMRYTREGASPAEVSRTALILHSSGSTGLPKPIWLSHRRIMTHIANGFNMTCFTALPWYHYHCITSSFQALYSRKEMFLYSSTLPLTAENLTTSLQSTRAEVLHAVPYVLKLLGEKFDGIEAMKKCKLVTFVGSQCPDQLGDHLVSHGINLVTLIGS